MPSSVKSITVVSCTEIPIKQKEKVYVQVKFGKQNFQTEKLECDKGEAAKWNASFPVKAEIAKDILFVVYDDDTFSRDDVLGQCVVKIEDDRDSEEVPLSLQLLDNKGKKIKSWRGKSKAKLDVIIEYQDHEKTIDASGTETATTESKSSRKKSKKSKKTKDKKSKGKKSRDKRDNSDKSDKSVSFSKTDDIDDSDDKKTIQKLTRLVRKLQTENKELRRKLMERDGNFDHGPDRRAYRTDVQHRDPYTSRSEPDPYRVKELQIKNEEMRQMLVMRDKDPDPNSHMWMNRDPSSIIDERFRLIEESYVSPCDRWPSSSRMRSDNRAGSRQLYEYDSGHDGNRRFRPDNSGSRINLRLSEGSSCDIRWFLGRALKNV